MYRIALIGAGQLGSRHLQGLVLSKLSLVIEVVDSNNESLDLAKGRFEEVAQPNIKVDYFNDINELSSPLDLVIIATGSVPRRQIIESVLSAKSVRNIILEKFLFPDIEDYEYINNLFKKYQLIDNVWVNCPKRVFDGYIKLAKELEGLKIFYSVTGFDWGLACNSIHFLDHFAMLTGDEISEVKLAGLDKCIYPSRRKGYIEFNGTITALSKKGSFFSATSLLGYNSKLIITIIDEKSNRWDIDESNDTISKNGSFWTDISFKFQSRMTGKIIDLILSDNCCALPKYTENAKTHLSFLVPAVDFYNKQTGNNKTFCPIT